MIIPFYLNRFLKRISDEFSRKATSKGLILYSEHKGLNVTVKGDADKLEQVLAISYKRYQIYFQRKRQFSY